MDYILNRCDRKSIEAVAAAVVRRRRELDLFGDSMPDPRQMARDVSSQINMGASIEGMRETIRNMAVRIIRQEAPELTDDQIDELTRAWIPSEIGGRKSAGKLNNKNSQETTGGVPRNLLASMIDQFISFSLGQMEEEEDQALRREMGPWPDKYWKSFPQVIRLLISDYLKGEISESDFNIRIELALKSR